MIASSPKIKSLFLKELVKKGSEKFGIKSLIAWDYDWDH